jgi:predicted RND superfamily exporter protein
MRELFPLQIYDNLILKNPRAVLFLIICLTVLAGFFSLNFELDASADSLVLENDDSLKYYRKIREQYGTDEFLIITYTPYSDLLSEESLDGLKLLRDQLLTLDTVESVISILDVPIIYNAGVKLSEIKSNLQTLESENVDKSLARKEFKTNPFYHDLLVSNDVKTTAIQIIFRTDKNYYDLVNRRGQLREESDQSDLNELETEELENIAQAINEYNKQTSALRERDIETIRKLMDKERHRAQLYLGGIPMITADMIRFIRHDLIVFGAGVLTFLILVLTFFFRKTRWVLLPLFCCVITGIITIGFLGLVGWSITVISSNFLSILLIITLSLTIHLIVRFRDLHIASPNKSHHDLILDTVASMARPCFYTILTTAVAFASLIVSEIRPVIDFGWIMVIGLVIALTVSFLVFPTILALLPATTVPEHKDFTRVFMLRIAELVQVSPRTIISMCVILSIAIGIGITQLEVENRFIDNFKSSTEIYQGMKVIDQELGGTTPLDIIIDPDQSFYELEEELLAEENDLDNLFLDPMDDPAVPNYWLNQSMMKKAQSVHKQLESYPTIGKVLSIGTAIQIVEKLNKAPLDDFELALIRKRVPDDIADDLIDPYLSEDANQLRFSLRVIETDPTLNRKQLLGSIHDYLVNEMHFEDNQVHLTGMLVLYNNMLQSLYRSQILTIGAVFVAIFLTFIVLFRSLILAVLGIIPNVFSAILILGIMGWFAIPLDMMTITIAAITIGISVDDTIHYIHRFKHEYAVDHDYHAAIRRCHSSIGKAMYHTTIAIIFGFGILSLSNFIPTIYFGLLTGLAMIVALLGDLLLLPATILILKPNIIR